MVCLFHIADHEQHMTPLKEYNAFKLRIPHNRYFCQMIRSNFGLLCCLNEQISEDYFCNNAAHSDKLILRPTTVKLFKRSRTIDPLLVINKFIYIFWGENDTFSSRIDKTLQSAIIERFELLFTG